MAIVSITPMNIRVRVSLRFRALTWYMPRSWISGSYGSSLSIVLRNYHAVFHSSCNSWHFHQQGGKVPFSSHPFQYLLLADFLMMAILTGVSCYLIIVLVCMSLIISDVEHLFMCLLAICMSSLEKCLLPIFWLGCLFFICWCYWVVWAGCVFWKLSPCSSQYLQIFSPSP